MGELENNSKKRRHLTRNRHNDSLKNSQLTLSQGMMQKGDVVVVADDDDETERQQHCVLRHCSSGLSIYALSSYQRKESDSQHDTWSVSAGFTPPQLTLHAIKQGLQCTHIAYNYICDWRRQTKPNFFYPGDTGISTNNNSHGPLFLNIVLPLSFKKMKGLEDHQDSRLALGGFQDSNSANQLN